MNGHIKQRLQQLGPHLRATHDSALVNAVFSTLSTSSWVQVQVCCLGRGAQVPRHLKRPNHATTTQKKCRISTAPSTGQKFHPTKNRKEVLVVASRSGVPVEDPPAGTFNHDPAGPVTPRDWQSKDIGQRARRAGRRGFAPQSLAVWESGLFVVIYWANIRDQIRPIYPSAEKGSPGYHSYVGSLERFSVRKSLGSPSSSYPLQGLCFFLR